MRKKSISSDFLVAHPSAASGIARFFDFAGTFDEYNQSPNEDEADAKAMYADWVVVGDSIRLAFCRVQAEDEADEKAA